MSSKRIERLIFKQQPLTYVSCRISSDGYAADLRYRLYFSGPQSKVISVEVTESELPEGFYADDLELKQQAIQAILNNKSQELEINHHE